MFLLCAFAACITGAPIDGLPFAVDTRHQAVSQDSRVRFIVLHYTSRDFEGALRRLTREEVSSHYLIDRDPPTVYQLVPEERRAWHAGLSSWQGSTALNASSVGIEIVNAGNRDDLNAPYQDYPPEQLERVVALVRDVQRRHQIKPHRIVGHAEVQPQTKQDPGPRFPWKRLADEGLIPWPDEAAVAQATERFVSNVPPVSWFQEKLAAHGFEVPRTAVLDPATRRVVASFQMKYRPARYDGEPDVETAALLEVVTSPSGLQLTAPDGSRAPYRPE